MSEKILSQDEIDALLSAMDKGEVELVEDEKEEVEVKTFDLTSQRVMLRGKYEILEEVYDKYVNMLVDFLSSFLQKNIEVKIISTEMVKFGEFIQSFSNPTGFYIFNMKPLIGSSLLAIEPNLVFSLIDCMFGGNGKPLNNIRAFTFIEQKMMEKLANEILNNFEKAWEIAIKLNINLKKTETKPEFVHLANPNDMMIIIVFSIKGSAFEGNLHLCLPYLMLEPIKDKLSSTYLREKDAENAFSSQIQKALYDTKVKITAELGKTSYTIKDIINLEVGDIIPLKKGPQDIVTINVEDVPKYSGTPGIVKGNRAIQLVKMSLESGGE